MKFIDREEVAGTDVTIGRKVQYRRDLAGNPTERVSKTYTAEYRDQEGNRHFHALGTSHKRDARRMALEIQHKLDEGRTTRKPGRLSMAGLIDRYTAFNVSKGLAPKTLAKYKSEADKLRLFCAEESIEQANAFTEEVYHRFGAWLRSRTHKQQSGYHNAGLGGYGGSSYIDSVMLRDRDGDTAWNAASDGTMEERVYYAQNFRHDVSALITDDGRMIEWVKYSSYGVPWSLPAGDTDSDGDFDATDVSAIAGTYDVRKDVNLDGTVDVADFLDALDLNNGYVNQGWSKLGLTKWGNRKGYAGYEADTALAGTKWHVRHRVLESELGRWMRRDPARYIDGPSLYGAFGQSGMTMIDSLGLSAASDPSTPAGKCATQLAEALNDPKVIGAMAAAQAHCPGATLPSPQMKKCSGGGEFSCSGSSTTLTVCYTSDGCPMARSIATTIAHELIHFQQYCGNGTGLGGVQENGGNCAQWTQTQNDKRKYTYREIEAYCKVELPGECRLANNGGRDNAHTVCGFVKGSKGSYCICMEHFGFPCRPWWDIEWYPINYSGNPTIAIY